MKRTVTPVEVLESRQLLAAAPLAPSASVVDGVLIVTGSTRADQITIDSDESEAGLNVSLNGQVQGFERALFATGGIRVVAGKGNDSVTVGASVTEAVQVFGDVGNDTVVGGSGNDLLDGGRGNDSLTGGAGHDTLLGDVGKDVLLGGSGNDSIDGGNAKDSLNGGDGNDDLHGGNGNDSIFGGAGDDDLYGDLGKDSCDGGDGADDLSGGKSRDRLSGGGGRDRFSADDDAREFDDRGTDDDADELITINDLPPEVVTAFQNQFGSAEITEVEQETVGDTTQYEVHYLLNGTPGEVKFSVGGNLIEGDVPLSLVPQAVIDAFNEQFPGVQLVGVEIEPEDGAIHFSVTYVENGVTKEVEYDAAGVVDIGGQDVDIGDLPSLINAALQQLYPGATVTSIETSIVNNVIYYELRFSTAAGETGEAVIGSDGSVTFIEA